MEDPVLEPFYERWFVPVLTHLQRETVGKGEQHSADTRQFCFSVERKMQYTEKQGFTERKKNGCIAVLHDFFVVSFQFSVF